jgi:hypothetical protein
MIPSMASTLCSVRLMGGDRNGGHLWVISSVSACLDFARAPRSGFLHHCKFVARIVKIAIHGCSL